ncbi:hypothetical protein SERLA73DRAFT_187259 [Serpula lacrymans var. lacrymans S7.3]|uniref:Uncharacterized protein n=2 Tax=Serpula lacrymans var. lacrymans TaxID=341189 RepID=F8Q8S0_SERL3|nr:uncharacterized protein SERLADRAFT_476698 [Serpula lacrymans var. lacrymans S7.9]EGN94975.1 hypothetical protein SERLA73DRAFT_187259 [Serpula lacrymans var. lacrymans S7.3]EGO20466.1 hypothetical protein SERLADRAFT_476698 [Serpula lacrymans var. lacrymans S7.9]
MRGNEDSLFTLSCTVAVGQFLACKWYGAGQGLVEFIVLRCWVFLVNQAEVRLR